MYFYRTFQALLHFRNRYKSTCRDKRNWRWPKCIHFSENVTEYGHIHKIAFNSVQIRPDIPNFRSTEKIWNGKITFDIQLLNIIMILIHAALRVWRSHMWFIGFSISTNELRPYLFHVGGCMRRFVCNNAFEMSSDKCLALYALLQTCLSPLV